MRHISLILIDILNFKAWDIIMKAWVCVAVCAMGVVFDSNAESLWAQCAQIGLESPAIGVSRQEIRCTSSDHETPYKINVLKADLANKHIIVKPIAVPNKAVLETLPDIAKSTNPSMHLIGGVNGGFFYNAGTDSTYQDNICPQKLYPQSDNLGNSLTQIDGQVISMPCDTSEHYSRSVLVLDNIPYITQVLPNQTIQQGYIPDAIGAGPTLVSDTNGSPRIDITQEGFTWYNSEAARTAVGIKGSDIFLVTVDKTETSNGVTISELADFMLNYLHVDKAINLDGGGSTTMCLNYHGICQIVNTPSSADGARKIYNGLFIFTK